eukprot:3124971-Pleurochrysis_carterae.AAC.1
MPACISGVSALIGSDCAPASSQRVLSTIDSTCVRCCTSVFDASWRTRGSSRGCASTTPGRSTAAVAC